MKKGLIFGLIAVLSATFLVIGCSQATDSEGTTSIQIGDWLVDIEVSTEDDLLAALANDDFKVIGVVGDSGTNEIAYSNSAADLDVLNVIPADKTVVLFATVAVGSPSLRVEGKLIVEGGGNLEALYRTNEVLVTPTGQIQVINGTLTVDGPSAVNGSPYNEEIFGTSRLVFAGGHLNITGPADALVDVEEALTWVPHGQVTIDSLTKAIKPSDLTKIQPQTTAVRRLTITDPINALTETETELIVPAGLRFITDEDLLSVTKLDVKGHFTASDALLARITDLTVSGTLAAPFATYSKVKKLTVNSPFDADAVSFPSLEDLIVSSSGVFETTGSIGTAVDSANGIGLEIAPAGIVEVDQIYSLRTSTIQGSLTADGFTPYAPTPALSAPSELRVAQGGSINGINFPGQVIVTALAADSVTIDDFTVPEDQGLNIPAAKTLVIGAGKTLTYDGQVTIAATGNLVLATDSTTSVGKIAGAGSITAGATTITGAWEAVGDAPDPGVLTILSAAAGATITATGDAIGLKASAAGATITQALGSGNALTIGAATTITLGGTNTTPLGAILLKSGADPAKLSFTNGTTSKVVVGAGTTGAAITGVTNPKIGGKAIVIITSFAKEDFKNDNNVLVLLGGTNAGGFTASATAGADVLIDSTVAAEGT
ncbi:hypothetical protein LQZ21_14485 [Treponema sp. TIM-1]|uniref:hypothetical protein n=1 Tax=Treponema sp. TIM-1 TaxID=2898417 RepID=UPI00397F50F4